MTIRKFGSGEVLGEDRQRDQTRERLEQLRRDVEDTGEPNQTGDYDPPFTDEGREE